MANPNMSNTPVTAKIASTFAAGQREILVAERVALLRVNPLANTNKIDRAISAMEYLEATAVAQRATKKSGFKAGVAVGFVPYAEREISAL